MKKTNNNKKYGPKLKDKKIKGKIEKYFQFYKLLKKDFKYLMMKSKNINFKNQPEKFNK